MPTITICSSANFYRQAVNIQAQLSKSRCKVLIPAVAEKMKQSGNYKVSDYKTWFGNTADYHKKTALMNEHFAEIEKGDAVLVLNYQKHGVDNYIGGNVLMEMTIAFYLKKPVFLLNEMPEESAYLEEIIGLNPIVLHGRAENILAKYEKLEI